MAVTFDGHESHIPRKHGIRNFFLTLAGVTTLGAGGAVLENRVGVIDPAQRFIQGLLRKEGGSAAAQTVAQPTAEATVEPVRQVVSFEEGLRRGTIQRRATALNFNGTEVRPTDGFFFAKARDGVVRECSDDLSQCLVRDDLRFREDAASQ